MPSYVAGTSQFRVNSLRAGSQDVSSITALADGGFLVVWSSIVNNVKTARAQRYDGAGQPVGTEFQLGEAIVVNTSATVVQGLSNGGFVAIWETSDTAQDGNGTALRAQIYDAAGSAVGSAFLVNNEAAGNQSSPQITSLSGGGFAVTWTTSQPAPGGTLSEVHTRTFDAAGVAAGPEVLVNTVVTGAQSGAALTALQAGGFVATWQSDGDIFGQRFDSNGVKLGGEFAVNTVTAGSQSSARVTSLSDGRFVVVWVTSPATGFVRTVSGQIFDANGNKLGAEFLISDPLGNPQIFQPDVDALPDGGFVVTWNATGGTDVSTAVWAQRYDAAGVAVGDDYIVNTINSAFETGGQTTVTAAGDIVTAWSSFQHTGELDVSARILRLNVAPVIQSDGAGAAAAYSVAEGQSTVTQVVATDQVANAPISYSISGGADASLFAINSATGHLTFIDAQTTQNPTDSDLDGTYEVIVAATDGEFSDTQTLSVTVGTTGRGLLIASPSQFSVSENQNGAMQISATDASATFAIVGGADASRFTINATTGALSFISAPNFEMATDVDGSNVYDVVISATAAGQTATQAVSVTVGNVNEGPVFSTPTTLSIAENSTIIANLLAPDVDGDLVSFSITGGSDSSLFSFNNVGNGILSFTTARNFEAPTDVGANGVYEVTISASDGYIITSRTFAISVINVNEGTMISSNGAGATAAFSMNENLTYATTVVARDNVGPTVTYSISGGFDASKFTINATTGVLSFITAPNYEAPNDLGANRVYDVTVAASDGIVTDTQAIAITINNVNEPFSITSHGGGDIGNVSIAENSLNLQITTNDPEGGPLTYSIIGGADAARFTLTSAVTNIGALNFISSPNFEAPLDADGNNIYHVVISISDGTFTDTQALNITITNVNENVIITGGSTRSVFLAENIAAVATIGATDPENALISFSISGGVDAAKFAINAVTGALSFVAAPNFEAPTDSGLNNVYDVIVRATDGVTAATQAVSVQISNVNESPIITSTGGGETASIAVNENLTAVSTVTSTDPENTARTYSIFGGADAALFTINMTTGALSFISARNFEAPADAGANNIYDIIVRASDGVNADTQAIAVTVANVNEAVTITSASSYAFAENGMVVGTVAATDLDGTAPTYAITGGADAALFTINATTGALSFVNAPNFEEPADAGANNIYNVTVRATDGVLSDTRALAVMVTDVNEAVVITSNGGDASAALSVAENAGSVTTITSTDPENTPRTYAISGGVDAALFTINASTGALSFVAAPNFEAPSDAGANNVYDIVVSASDGVNSDTQALAVTVTNSNEGLTFISGTTFGITENATAVAIVSATDIDGDPVSYAIAGGADAALFAIDAITGALSFVTPPNFEAPADAGADNVYDVIVSASDGSFTGTSAIAVSIGNANEGVSITSVAAYAAAENSTSVGSVSATDIDGDAVSYSIVGGADASLFAVDAVTGALSFVTAPDHETPADADGNNVYEVVVQASDGALLDSQAIAVTVGNVNEAPVITSNGGGATAAIGATENSTVVTTVTAGDIDGHALTFAIAGGSDAALFTIDPVTGVVSFIGAPNFEAPLDAGADNIYGLLVSANDGLLLDTQSLAISVANINETPEIISGGGGATASYAVAENGTSVATVTATDPDGNPQTYSIVGGADAARFTIDAMTGALSFVSAANFEAPTDADSNNIYDVIVSASDGTQSDTQAISVTVGNVNEAPVITSNGGGATASVSASENSIAVTTVAAGDIEGQAVTFAIAGGADAALFAIDPVAGVVSFIGAPNFEAPLDAGADNIYGLLVSASDGLLLDFQSLVIAVGNVNEAPVITSNGGGATAAVTVNENQVAVAMVASTDPDANPRNYSIIGGADAARFTINATTGTLSFINAPNFEVASDVGANNVYDVIVQASDGTLIDTQSIAVTVANVNEAPVITSNGGGATASVAVNENKTAVTTITSTDPEGAARTYSIIGGADAARFTVNASTGVLSFVSAPNFEAPTDVGVNNVYDLVVQVSDGVNITSQALAVAVNNVVDGSTINGTNSANTLTGTVAEDTISGLGGNDIITGGLGADRLTGGTGADRFTYTSALDSTVSNMDVITDFTRSQSDRISLSAIDANANVAGDQAFAFIGAAAFSNVAGQLRYQVVNGNTIISGDVNGDGMADFAIQVNGTPTPIAIDFIF